MIEPGPSGEALAAAEPPNHDHVESHGEEHEHAVSFIGALKIPASF